MLKIGDVTIPNRVFAAPMAGVADKAFRILAKEYGCGLVFTEMINAMGLIYKQARTEKLADIKGELPPVAIQIFGSEPEKMGEAAHIAESMGADLIDLNMGCPTPKIVRNGAGAALMLDIRRCRMIIRAVTQAVKIPVTVKMRSGWDQDHLAYLELGGAAEQEGAHAVTLHARYRMQFYSGHADWKQIARLKKNLSIPVIGNGDITSPEDAFRMINETACDAVMIGRAALGNPFIFQQTVHLLEKGTVFTMPTVLERMDMARRQLDLTVASKGEFVAVKEMRKHLGWYIKGLSGAASNRVEINRAVDYRQMMEIIERIKMECG
ncbi:MAG TPA: tRNA dihydrouridine synthase DusB [Syntrophomonadaceae bacterium]|nr:tRNA dihydrouridine synthase DusB [Syntrophomonadaceae bacterium]HNX28830.1 tRNA dihydrouridine synthase DusB [Syntrophomonadaceae bacterium]HPR93302.1 tRNA dihydrouridine synthase DusB [Syntrophomonadaceae bacterium]